MSAGVAGAKARILIRGTFGPTEVVPFYKTYMQDWSGAAAFAGSQRSGRSEFIGR
jgi:hypothetical protein